MMPAPLAGRLVHVEPVARNIHCQAHSCGALGYFAPSAPGNATLPRLAARSESCCRFIRAMCPVLELGLVGQTMHQIDERVPVAEIEALSEVYRRVIEGYFARTA